MDRWVADKRVYFGMLSISFASHIYPQNSAKSLTGQAGRGNEAEATLLSITWLIFIIINL